MKIQVITSEDFDDSELKEIQGLFKEAGYEAEVDNEGMLIKSAEQLPPAIWIFIGMAAGAYFTGFFQKAGSDAWDKMKECIKKLKAKRKKGQATQVRLHLEFGDHKITIIPMPDDAKELEIALEFLPEYLDKNLELNAWIWFHNNRWGTREEHIPEFRKRDKDRRQ